jgi:hypothetical protein
MNKVLKSTLSSSGIFFQTNEGKYYFKEREAIDYVIKATEKVVTKKMEKEKKDSKSLSTTSSNKTKRKRYYEITQE